MIGAVDQDHVTLFPLPAVSRLLAAVRLQGDDEERRTASTRSDMIDLPSVVCTHGAFLVTCESLAYKSGLVLSSEMAPEDSASALAVTDPGAGEVAPTRGVGTLATSQPAVEWFGGASPRTVTATISVQTLSPSTVTVLSQQRAHKKRAPFKKGNHNKTHMGSIYTARVCRVPLLCKLT